MKAGMGKMSVNKQALSMFSFFFILFAVVFLYTFSSNDVFAEVKAERPAFTLEIIDNFIHLKAKEASFKEILNDLEKKTGIKVNIFDGVDNKKITLNISALPVYAIHTLLEKMGLENFAVVYDKELASKIIYILPKGKDIAEVIKGEKGKTIIRSAKYADGKNVNQIKGHEIVTITRGMSNEEWNSVKDYFRKFIQG